MHSASYVNERMAAAREYIGRSEGCPAIPVKWHKKGPLPVVPVNIAGGQKGLMG